MRVLLFANNFPPGYTGGAEVATYHTVRGLMERGYDCSVCVLNNRQRQTTADDYDLDGIPVHRVHVRPWGFRNPVSDVIDPRMYRAARREIRKQRPDIVHVVNVSGSTLSPFLACRDEGVPVVNTLHDLWLLCPNNMLYRKDGGYCEETAFPGGCRRCFRRYDYWGALPFRRRLFAALTRVVRHFVCPSQAIIDRHVAAGYDRGRFRLVRNGFSPAWPAVEGSHPFIEKLYETRDGHRTLVFAGGGCENKGVNVLCEAIPRLLDRFPDLRIVVAGGGDLLHRFRPFEPHVLLAGKLPFAYMRQLIELADLMLVPSVWFENAPVTIYESYQVGTPVVATDFGGIPEFVDHGKTGFLFRRGDGKQLAERITAFFQLDEGQRKRMQEACRQRVKGELSFERHLDTLQGVYEEVMAHP